MLTVYNNNILVNNTHSKSNILYKLVLYFDITEMQNPIYSKLDVNVL